MTLISGVFAWLWNRSEKSRDDLIKGHSVDIDALRREIADHRLHVAQAYVSHPQLAKTIESFERTVERLLVAINQMARDSKESLAEIHRRIDGKEDK